MALRVGARRARWRAFGGIVAAVVARPGIAWADGDGTPEVLVLAPHRDVGETTVRREDTRDLPGTFGDPTRVMEALPGVVPTASGLQAFFVRGAPPTATGYFIDGVPVPVLYHVGFGPSVIHPALIDHVDFYQGAPPATYGRYVGGVLSATTVAPADHPHAEANVRLFDAGGIVETPFADGQASALAAARYGYPGTVLPLFETGVGLSYWDYQARATLKTDDRDRIGAFVFGSYDRLTQVQQNAAGQSYTQQLSADEFHRVDLRWDRTLGPTATMRLAATLGRDVVGDDVSNSIDDIARLRAELDSRPSNDLRVRAGADVQIDRLRPGTPPEGSPGGTAISPSRDAVIVGAHADAAWRITRRVELTPGLRAEVYSSTVYPAPSAPILPGTIGGSATPVLEPRLAARVRVATGVTTVSTFGVSHQLPGIVAQYPETTPYIQPGVLTGLQSSAQASQGVELALPLHLSLATTAFLHDYAGLPDITACAFSPQDPSQCVTPTVRGQAYGLEVLLRRALTERFTVWVSYTLSRSTRQARPPGGSEPTMTILSEYDRTHVVSAVASYDLGKDWRVGGRVFAYSGRPYTDFSMSNPVLPFDSERLPGFFRLDARFEKSWKLGEKDRITVVLEGINVTLSKEVVSASCGGPATPATPSYRLRPEGMTASVPINSCTLDSLGPITIPSIGVEGTFR
jgi:hypothetical protein